MPCYHQSASLPGAARGVAHCLLTAERAEQSAAFAEAARYLRMALALSDSSDARRPRLHGRLALALIWHLALNEAEQAASDAAGFIATAEGDDAAADFLADAADAMSVAAGTPQQAWPVAARGLSYLGGRRDATWARLMVHDIPCREAADPEFPGIPLDSPERHEVMTHLWELPSFRHPFQRLFAYMGFRSREDALLRAGDDPLALVYWAGEYRRGLPLYEQEATTALELGQIGLATINLTSVARIQAARGDLTSSMSTYARLLELYQRINEPAWLRPFISVVPLAHVIVTGEGWELVLAALEARLQDVAVENQWLLAAMTSQAAYAAAYLGRSDQALHWLTSILPAIDRAPGAAANYPALLSTATTALDELGRTDHIGVLERNVREKWLKPDFRYLMTDARFSLGMLCGLQGRVDEAAEWFARARVILEEQGAFPMRARTDFHEARMYLRRDAPGDRERAATLLDAALEQFRPLGMTGWVRRAEELLTQCAAQPHETPQQESGRDASAKVADKIATLDVAQLRHEGEYWTVTYDGTTARVRDVKGLQYIARLLGQPGQEFHVLDIVQGTGSKPQGSESSGLRTQDAGLEALDGPAKAAYRRRIAELREELEESEQSNDRGRSERAREEMEAISEQLAGAVGLGGRDRRAASASERARSAVAKRINEALKKLTDASPTLADHLRGRVRTGTFCVYLPDAARPIEWEL